MIEEKQNVEPEKSLAVFFRVIKGFLLADAALVLWIGSGFVVPSKLTPPPDAALARADGYYDYSAKVSPCRGSRRTTVAQARVAKVETAGL